MSDNRLRDAYLLGRQFGYGATERDWLDLPDLCPEERQAFSEGFSETAEPNQLRAVLFSLALFAAVVCLASLALWGQK